MSNTDKQILVSLRMEQPYLNKFNEHCQLVGLSKNDFFRFILDRGLSQIDWTEVDEWFGERHGK